MPRLYVARRLQRGALLLPMGATHQNPSLLFMLPTMSTQQLDEMIRKQLEKQGVTKENEIQNVVEEAEKQYEHRVKVVEAQREVRRLMKIRAVGGSLMQVGWRRWKQVFYPAIKRFKK